MEDIKSKNGRALPLRKLSNYYSSPIDLEKDDRISGLYAWIGIFTAVTLYDVYAVKTKKAETLTRAFWRGTEEPVKAIATLGLWTILTTHLIAEKNIRKKIFGEKN